MRPWGGHGGEITAPRSFQGDLYNIPAGTTVLSYMTFVCPYLALGLPPNPFLSHHLQPLPMGSADLIVRPNSLVGTGGVVCLPPRPSCAHRPAGSSSRGSITGHGTCPLSEHDPWIRMKHCFYLCSRSPFKIYLVWTISPLPEDEISVSGFYPGFSVIKRPLVTLYHKYSLKSLI